MKFVTIRRLVSENLCDKIVSQFYNESLNSVDMNLADGSGDFTNTIYESKRSPNLRYNYLDCTESNELRSRIVPVLEDMLMVQFGGSINDIALPVFEYVEGGEILAHRGVQKEGDTKRYQPFVCVIQLTQRGVDFDGGRFYVNSKATASEDGKTVYNDNIEDRIYPMLNKGDACLIHNPSLVHGVDVVTRGVRLTCSFRTNNDQK